MKKIYFHLPAVIFIIFTQMLWAQNFEYALTEKELAGAKIMDLLRVDDRIYLAGGTKHEGQPVIIVFDTLGHLLDHHIFLPEKPDHYYGYIGDLYYEKDQAILVAVGSVAPGCDIGGPAIFRWDINSNLEVLSEYEFSVSAPASYSDPRFYVDDSIISISIREKTVLYNRQNEIIDEISLPEDLSSPEVIVYQNHLIAFDDYLRQELIRIDMAGNSNLVAEVNPFSKIEVVPGKLILAGEEGILRIYDPVTLELLDSLENPGYSSVEFSVLNQEYLQITFTGNELVPSAGIYDLDLNLIRAIPSHSIYETNFISILDDNQNIYQISSYYNINFSDSRIDGLVPVIRKISPSGVEPFERPALEITNVQINNPDAVAECLPDPATGLCMYPSVFLQYELTIQNNVNHEINSAGHYVGTFLPSFCGYLYQDYRYYDNLTLLPGERLTIKDSVWMGWIADAPKLNFYLVAPNHVLSFDQDSAFYTLENISTSALEQKKPELLKIFPNPTPDYLILPEQFFHVTDFHIDIFTVTGQQISPAVKDGQIDVHQLQPGVHYLRIRNQQKIYLSSFIKIE